ncbi:MAG TPA: elongation factor G [Acidobacteriota bacterium]|nr:elongation factor G [Acidobacteriota bacterium]
MAVTPLERVRNVGIIAHIDAGKTTATERFLFYSGRTHKIGEVHDGQAVMDFRDDERERGITISAAATTFAWNSHQINLIDTPGHVDFTAEVERSLRVLDGAVVIFSGVEGVEPQSETVWHQADRYQIPRLAFINKLDRAGSDHQRVLKQIETRLRAQAALVNLPHGAENGLDGIVDVIERRLTLFDPSTRGRDIETLEVPQEMTEAVEAARSRLVECAANSVEWLADLYLSGDPVSAKDLRRAIREATLSGNLIPVLCGAALRDLGVQPVLDAICYYLPSPLDRPAAQGMDLETGKPILRPLTLDAPFSALVFKVVATSSTDYLWLRVYSGSLSTEERCYHPRTKTRLRLRRILRLHADRTEPVEQARCGDIVAVHGLKDIRTGDTLCDPEHPITFEPIHFPQTVVSMAVETQTSADRDRLYEVVTRLLREDPTLVVGTDEDTGQMILSGMGELHLEVTRNRMLREFNVSAFFGRPRVSYRETVTARGVGKGEFEKRISDVLVSGKAAVEILPRPRTPGDRSLAPVEVDVSRISKLLTSSLEREAQEILLRGCNSGGTHGYPIVDVKVNVLDFRHNDPPDVSVPLLGTMTLALREAIAQAQTIVLEPVMSLEVRVPEEFLGAIMKDLGSRRAEIHDTEMLDGVALVRGLVPLAEMFGYSTQMRSLTQGRGSFSMEPFDYQPAKSWV